MPIVFLLINSVPMRYIALYCCFYMGLETEFVLFNHFSIAKRNRVAKWVNTLQDSVIAGSTVMQRVLTLSTFILSVDMLIVILLINSVPIWYIALYCCFYMGLETEFVLFNHFSIAKRNRVAKWVNILQDSVIAVSTIIPRVLTLSAFIPSIDMPIVVLLHNSAPMRYNALYFCFYMGLVTEFVLFNHFSIAKRNRVAKWVNILQHSVIAVSSVTQRVLTLSALILSVDMPIVVLLSNSAPMRYIALYCCFYMGLET